MADEQTNYKSACGNPVRLHLRLTLKKNTSTDKPPTDYNHEADSVLHDDF